MADLRNAFAVAAILHGWQHSVGSANIWFPLYTDYFDLYPLFPSRDGSGLICDGFGLNSFDDAAKFKGQPYPDLSKSGFIRVEVGNQLRDQLVEEWKAKYSTPTPSWKQTALFRSLAIAYRAARLPKGCDHLIFDIGVQLSLWVSAHECLTHPGPGKQTNLNEVLTLIGKARWRQKKLRVKRRQVKWRSNGKPKLTEPMTYAQHLYRRLYNARNEFLHGNPVNVKTAFLGASTRDGLSIQVAPLIFSSALEAFLSPAQPRKKRGIEEIIEDALRFIPLENALLKTRERRKTR